MSFGKLLQEKSERNGFKREGKERNLKEQRQETFPNPAEKQQRIDVIVGRKCKEIIFHFILNKLWHIYL